MYVGPATLTEKTWISSRTLILKLELEEEVNFIPGQFFTFFFTVEGKKKPRSYSILEMNGKELVLCIKLVDDGLASKEFEKAKISDIYQVRGPFGQFIYRPDDNEKIWLIATDTGIVPFHAMIQQGDVLQKDITLLFGSRNQEEIYFREEYERLTQNGNFIFLPTLTREDWPGLKGRVQTHLPNHVSDTTFYVCGRKEMVLEVTQILKNRGATDDQIRIERYD